MPTKNPFLDYLEDRPEAGYFSFQDQWKTPNQKKYFQSQFSNIQNQYMGQLGQWVKAGSQGDPRSSATFLEEWTGASSLTNRRPKNGARIIVGSTRLPAGTSRCQIVKA